MAETYNILAVGDAVGSHATSYLKEKLHSIIQYHAIDLTVVNGENSADGNGMLPQSAEAIYDAGADVITGGNHSFRRREVYGFLDDSGYCVRPANMPSTAPGFGYTVIDAGGRRVLVMNLLGNVYMDPVESPFVCADRILEANKGKYDYAVVDIHAEATSEKAALARYLDGRVSVVFGTHTHVATADEQILPKGTGFITDLGMVGVNDSILGVKSEIIIEKFISRMPVRFEQAVGKVSASGAIFMLDKLTGKCVKVQRISF
ncbi:MAG: YmdB family metallophosphoesterase [Clostridia bacterium]|nr:YmdB family metallophosphoesterase [Clostridia bacterium]